MLGINYFIELKAMLKAGYISQEEYNGAVEFEFATDDYNAGYINLDEYNAICKRLGVEVD